LPNLVEFLLLQGAFNSIEDINGLPPLAYAEKGHHEKIVELLLQPNLAKENSDKKVLFRFKDTQFAKDLIERNDCDNLEIFLCAKNLINCEDKAGSTLLHIAAYVGNLDALKLLISLGSSVNSRDNENLSALHKAVLGGHLECVKFLVTSGADLSAKDNDGLTVLHHACYGRLDIVKYLVKSANNESKVQATSKMANGDSIRMLDAVDNDHANALHHAVIAGHVKILKYLLSHNLQADVADVHGLTGLHLAASDNQLECGQLLLNANPSVANQKDNDGLTPLHHACFLGYFEFAQMLLKLGKADVCLRDNSNRSPLDMACFRGHSPLVKLLLEHGADAKGITGQTSPIHHAAFGGSVPCVELLLNVNVDLNCIDKDHSTALHKACFNGHVELVRFLLQRGALFTAQDEEGSTPLHKSSYSGKEKVVEILLEYGAEVDAQDADEGTALHNACFNGHLECVKLLLASQANLNGADSRGASPLHLAVLNGHLEVAKLLVENGAQVEAPDDRGMIPLHHAIAHTSCLSFLIERGTPIDYLDKLGRSALFYAIKNNCEEPCRFLISKGADANLKDINGVSPFESATPSFQKVLLLALKAREQQVDSETTKKYQIAAKLFNQKPQKGIEYLISNQVIEGFPEEIAKFLHTAEGISNHQVGDLIGDGDPYNARLLAAFVNYMDFSGLDFDDALRYFLSKFALPGEAQKIDRIMERFAIRYCENNPTIFPNQDTAYILAFSLIMLNTDAHSPHIKNKMTKEQFVKNNRGICAGQNLPQEYLESLYDKIIKNPMKMTSEGSVFASAENKGWCKKQGGRIKTWKRRWFVLKDNCLYYFKQPSNEQPCGIIPLENLSIRTLQVKGHKNVFEVYSQDGEIKSCKLENGQLVKGHHGSYLISAFSKEDMENWISSIRNNISFNPLFELIRKRINEQDKPTTVAYVDFQELHEACLMCSMCYKSMSAVKDAYGTLAVAGEDSRSNIHYFLLTHDRAKIQKLVLCGTITEQQFNVANGYQPQQPPEDAYSVYQLDKAAEQIDRTVMKLLRKDCQIHIYGHAIGAALALILTLHLQNDGFKLGKLITFGQPKIVKQKESGLYKSISILRVVDYFDPVVNIFPGYIHIGSSVILLQDTYYSYVKQPLSIGTTSSSSSSNSTRSTIIPPEDDSTIRKRYDNNHIEAYLRNLKAKLRAPAFIAYDEHKKILQ